MRKLIDEKVDWWESQLMRKLTDEKVNWWESWLMRKSIDEKVDFLKGGLFERSFPIGQVNMSHRQSKLFGQLVDWYSNGARERRTI